MSNLWKFGDGVSLKQNTSKEVSEARGILSRT
jgi:hypothetical protein